MSTQSLDSVRDAYQDINNAENRGKMQIEAAKNRASRAVSEFLTQFSNIGSINSDQWFRQGKPIRNFLRQEKAPWSDLRYELMHVEALLKTSPSNDGEEIIFVTDIESFLSWATDFQQLHPVLKWFIKDFLKNLKDKWPKSSSITFEEEQQGECTWYTRDLMHTLGEKKSKHEVALFLESLFPEV